MYPKERFIRLVYIVVGWSSDGCLHAGEAKNLVAAQSKKWGSSEGGRPVMQSQPEAPWRTAPVSS